MSVTVATLQTMVEGATVAQVKAAVADYSMRNPVKMYAEISRNAENDKAFDLPADFLSLVQLVEADELSGYYVAAGLMSFTVAPQADTLHIWYAAHHTLNEGYIYPNLGQDEAHIIGLKIRAMVAGAADDGTTEYKVGDVQVKRDIKKQVEALESQYLAAVEAKIGPIGSRSRYTDLDMAGLR